MLKYEREMNEAKKKKTETFEVQSFVFALYIPKHLAFEKKILD